MVQESVIPSPERGYSGQQDTSRLPSGFKVLQAESARAFEVGKSGELLEATKGMGKFPASDAFKQDRRKISRLIKLEIMQVSANKHQVSCT